MTDSTFIDSRLTTLLPRLLIARADAVSEPSAEYNAAVEYEYHFVEYEYEYEEQPEPSDATEDRWQVSTNGCSNPGPR